MEDKTGADTREKKNIILDEELQIEIMRFFAATSIPRLLKKEDMKSQS